MYKKDNGINTPQGHPCDWFIFEENKLTYIDGNIQQLIFFYERQSDLGKTPNVTFICVVPSPEIVFNQGDTGADLFIKIQEYIVNYGDLTSPYSSYTCNLKGATP